MTNQEKTDLRKALQNFFEKLNKKEQEKYLAIYLKNPGEFVDMLEKNDHISEKLANEVTL